MIGKVFVLVLKPDKSIITYGFNDKENKFIDCIKLNGVNYNHIIIRKSMVNMKIKNIIDKNNHSYTSNDSSDEKIILFDQLDKNELDTSMNFIKNKFDIPPIFAVVTKTSSEWTFDYLIDHLVQEREWFKKQQNKK